MHAQSLLDVATEAAHGAGQLLLSRFRRPVEGLATKSSPTDLVSDADRDSEALLLEAIRRARPEDGVLSEEGGGGRSNSGLRWIIDPLDGTVNFLFGIPVWAVSVAVEDERGTVAGVVHDPVSRETFAAARGEGATLNGEPMRVSQRGELARALIGTGFSYDQRTRAAQAELLPRVLPEVRDVRRAGSAALDLASVACGRLDGFYEADMHVWDWAAGELLVIESGGVVTPLPAPVGDARGVLASNPTLHERLRAVVVG